MPCPEKNRLSADDLMQVVTIRAVFYVTKQFSPEMRSFIEYMAEHYSAETIKEASKLFNENKLF